MNGQEREAAPPDTVIPLSDESHASQPSGEVEVSPVAEDSEIAARLERILNATEWYDDPTVTAEEGVVFLEGTADLQEQRDWAGQLARNTQDVVAVVNRMQVRERSLWDFGPAWMELRSLFGEAIQSVPLLLAGLLLLVMTWLAAGLVTWIAGRLMRERIESALLRRVAVRALTVPAWILGLYLVLRVAGLTQMAVTVIGGTGLIGLVVGIAFRDIAENFLASILISTQRPFRAGDLVRVGEHQGFVQCVTTRGTTLMTLQGNHVQVPNSTIYKSTIVNYTANPKLLINFLVGIDYGDSVSQAQEVVLDVLRGHPAVLPDPEPLVLVEELGPSTVNLRVQFWINGHEHSQYKVRSSLVRLTKRAIERAGLTMPDESREVIFPNGVPVTLSDAESGKTDRKPNQDTRRRSSENDEVALRAEGGLSSERDEIAEQARSSRQPDTSTNLLPATSESAD